MAVSVPGDSIGASGTMRHSEGLSHLLDLLEQSRPAWQADALCLEYPAVDFYDDNAAGKAQAICRRCLVQPECRAFAIDNCEPGGVWGGLAEEELAAYVAVPRTIGGQFAPSAPSAKRRRIIASGTDWTAGRRVRRGGRCHACERDGLRISPRFLRHVRPRVGPGRQA